MLKCNRCSKKFELDDTYQIYYGHVYEDDSSFCVNYDKSSDDIIYYVRCKGPSVLTKDSIFVCDTAIKINKNLVYGKKIKHDNLVIISTCD
jgi:hypothetical protein